MVPRELFVCLVGAALHVLHWGLRSWTHWPCEGSCGRVGIGQPASGDLPGG